MKYLARYASLGCLFGCLGAQAQIVDNFTFTINGDIPDNDDTGFSSTRSVTSAITSIGDLNVTLNISGRGGNSAFNGDLYVTLAHSSGYSVLLNRVGRRNEINGFSGYTDDGLDVTFDDYADVDVSGNGDIHTYRLALNGSHTSPVSGPLTGTWSPDARTDDPEDVFTTSTRSAFLGSFNGLNPNGNWTLFVADLSATGQARLVQWGLSIAAVPEPAHYAATAAGGLLGLALWRRRWRTRAGKC